MKSQKQNPFCSFDRNTARSKERCRRGISRTPRRHRIFPLKSPCPCFPIPFGSSSSDEHSINRCLRMSMEEIRNPTILRTFTSPKRTCRVWPSRDHPFFDCCYYDWSRRKSCAGGELRRGFATHFSGGKILPNISRLIRK